MQSVLFSGAMQGVVYNVDTFSNLSDLRNDDVMHCEPSPNPLYDVAGRTYPNTASNPVYFKNLSLKPLVENESSYDTLQHEPMKKPAENNGNGEYSHLGNPIYDCGSEYDHLGVVKGNNTDSKVNGGYAHLDFADVKPEPNVEFNELYGSQSTYSNLDHAIPRDAYNEQPSYDHLGGGTTTSHQAPGSYGDKTIYANLDPSDDGGFGMSEEDPISLDPSQ